VRESTAVHVNDLLTPALVVDIAAFDANVTTMAKRWPGPKLRPHVKAFKSTALARRLAGAGHSTFCCATVREMEGMAAAGLGDDLLLANEVLGPAAQRLGALARSGSARVTAAVDSEATVDAAASAGVSEVLIDVNCGLPRCGCDPADAARLADRARAAGMEVRGVMGYEGHLMREPDERKRTEVAKSGEIMRRALDDVGGDVISGGGTGTWSTNDWATELQAGSYCLMDTEYVPHASDFVNALTLVCTLISANDHWGVLDGGLKSLGMDHGDPRVDPAVGDCWFVSDEHTTFGWRDGTRLDVGSKVRIVPAHVDPTVAYHERLHVLDGEEVVDTWPVDLRGW
jgi:D-serine deaminase-like pyridoxal phosphate-dependent protein